MSPKKTKQVARNSVTAPLLTKISRFRDVIVTGINTIAHSTIISLHHCHTKFMKPPFEQKEITCRKIRSEDTGTLL